MQVDFLIIGQGISGTWLSYYLQQEGAGFMVIDAGDRNAPSRISAGIINPVTGRRHVEVWMAAEILPFATSAYRQLGSELGITAISQRNIIDFFPSPQMRQSFTHRVGEGGEYVFLPADERRFSDYFNYDFGYGEIAPAYTAHLETILPAWRQKLKENNKLLEEVFDRDKLQLTGDAVEYKEIRARMIVFCDGNGSAANPLFSPLPFAPNKGEVLTAEIPGLPAGHIYKRGMMLAPLATEGQWWIGSDYAWEFEHTAPTAAFREKTEQLLKNWLKVPFSITGHYAGIRPATLERRPFAGTHPQYPHVAILNGMGTKGCSLAPYFARQLAGQLLHGHALNPEADIRRFRKLLSRNIS